MEGATLVAVVGVGVAVVGVVGDAVRHRLAEPVELEVHTSATECRIRHPNGADFASIRVEILGDRFRFEDGKARARIGHMAAGDERTLHLQGEPRDVWDSPAVRLRPRRPWTLRRDPAQLYEPPVLFAY